MRRMALVVLLVCAGLAAGCSTTCKATDYNGLMTSDGKAATHYNTTNWDLELLFKEPVWGDATLQQTMADCTAAAQADGAKTFRTVQSKRNVLWWVLFPVSLIVQPVVSNVAGDAY